MSEYQYYEFQALDRPLSAEAREEMHSLSSRAHVTASSASFVYNYSDLPANPYCILAKHFDAMLYIANWGTRQLMFRFPASAISKDVIDTYRYADNLEWSTEGKYIILNIMWHDETGESWGWVEGEGLLMGITQLRQDILRGDYRALYLAWLNIAHYEMEVLEDDEDLIEPSTPPNLQSLSPALQNFIDFFEINEDLITTASQASPTVAQVEEDLSKYLDQLTDTEKHNYLERLLNGESNLDIDLANRLRELSGTAKSDTSSQDKRRTIRYLVEESHNVTEHRQEEKRRQAEVAHLKKLEAIAQKEDILWSQISGLIEQKKTKAYEEAINILKDLRDLAQHRGQLSQFKDKMREIKQEYPTLSGLHRQLEKARLI